MLPHLFIHGVSYLGMFLLLSGIGGFTPISEEITLLTAGYLSAIGIMNPWKAIPLCIIAILIGDSVLFLLAKKGAPYAEKLKERVTRLRLERTWFFNPKHPLRAVFFMRFITGMRIISPVYAGFHEAKWKGFLLTTFGALLIFVPLLFGIGFYFSASLRHFIHGFEILRHIVFISFLGLVTLTMLAILYHYTPHSKRRRAEKEAKIINGI